MTARSLLAQLDRGGPVPAFDDVASLVDLDACDPATVVLVVGRRDGVWSAPDDRFHELATRIWAALTAMPRAAA